MKSTQFSKWLQVKFLVRSHCVMAVESQLSWTPSIRPHAFSSHGRQNRPSIMRLSTSVPCNLNHLEGESPGPTRLLLLGPRPLESARRQNMIAHVQPTSSLATRRIVRAGTPGTPNSPVTADRRWVHISRPGSMEEAPPPGYDDIDIDGGAISEGSRSSSSSPTPAVAPPREDVVLESRRSVTRASVPRTFGEPSGSSGRDSPQPFPSTSDCNAPAFSPSSLAARRNSVTATSVASPSPSGSSATGPSTYRAWSPLVTPRLAASPSSSSLSYHYHRPSPLSVRSESMSPFLHSYYNSPLHSYRNTPMHTYRRTHTWAPISSYMVTQRPLSSVSNSVRCPRRSMSNSCLSTLSALSSINSSYSNSRDDISSIGRLGYTAFHRNNSMESVGSESLASPSTMGPVAMPMTPDSPQSTHTGPWFRDTNSSNPASPTQSQARFHISSNIPNSPTHSHHRFRVANNNSTPASPTQARIHISNTPTQQESHAPVSNTPASPTQAMPRPNCLGSTPPSPTHQSPQRFPPPASRRLSLPHVRVSVQRLDLQRQNSEDSEAVRGQIVISLISRDRGGGGVPSQPSAVDSSSSSAQQHPPAIPYDPNELPEG